MEINPKIRAAGAIILAVGMSVAALTGCSSSANTSHTKANYTFWDPYPQYDASSAWAKVINSCAADAGVTRKQTAHAT